MVLDLLIIRSSFCLLILWVVRCFVIKKDFSLSSFFLILLLLIGLVLAIR